MKQGKNEPDPDAAIRKENEEIKERLKKEFGAIEMGGGLPPDMENAWLKSILAFEQTYKEEQKQTTKSRLPLN